MKISKAVPVLLLLLFSLPSWSQITSTRLGDGTGEDWEPAVMAFTGTYVYALWPHFGPTTYRDTSGATCLPYSPKVKTGTTTAYMYFQMSNNGTWSTVVIPRCPVSGNVVDAQLAIGSLRSCGPFTCAPAPTEPPTGVRNRP